MKTILITGANRGIGLELTKQYAVEGCRVVACSRDPKKSVALNSMATKYPELIKIHALDVSDSAQIERLAQTLSNEPIDILINNAGIYPKTDASGFGNTNYTDWMTAFSINTMAPLKMAETFVKQIALGKQKIIVTITSQMGSIEDNSSGGNYLYRSSKAAANMVMKSLAVDLRAKGIIAVAFNPGWVKTDMGGPNAMISVEQSVAGMRQVISKLTLTDSGKFLGYEGNEIPW
jgi:NAD(P)-dependent dehydrogenase (short-subunit alcohol dehydrogenase family)